MKRRDKILLAIGSVIAAGLLFATFALPVIIRHQLEDRIGSAMGRDCTIAVVAMNPLTLTAEVRGAQLLEKGSKAVFASFSTARLEVSPSSLWRLAPVVRSATLQSPYLHVVRTGENRYNFSDLLNKPQPKKEPSAPPRFSFNNLVIANGRIDFDDQALSQPSRHRVEHLTIQIPFISSIPYFVDRYVEPKISATVNGAPLQFNGRLKPFKKGFMSEVNLSLKELDLPFYSGYLPKELPLRITGGKLSTELEISHRLAPGDRPEVKVSGTVTADGLALAQRSGVPLLSWERFATAGKAEISYDDAAGLTLSWPSLQLRNLTAPFGPREGVDLPMVTVDGGLLRLKERQFRLKRLVVNGGRVALSRDRHGRLSSGRLMPSPSPAPAEKTASGPFRWQVDNIAITGLAATFADGTKEEKPRFSLKQLSVTARDITGPELGETPFTLAARYGSSGRIAAQGRILPKPFRLQADCTVQRIPILDADPYLPEGVNLVLVGGKLNARVRVNLAQKATGLSGSFQGRVGIHDFHSLNADGEEDLLKWGNLQLEGIKGTLSPFTLAMTSATLQDYYARIIIDKSARLNLQELYSPPAKPAAAPSSSKPAAARPAATPATSTTAVRIDTVTLQNGVIDFSDHHLSREFSTRMLSVGGRISGLGSEPGKAADVDLRGNLENQSPLRITGKVNPLGKDLFLDLAMNFSDIELSPLSPYSATYLGYLIEKGKLSVAVRYRIEQKKLTAENKIFLDQFTFGQRVESSKAASLPVRLAVALLKDRKGEIHLDLPLSGRTDEPDFSIWRVVGTMLKNLLVKAATSPFALLGSVFGGGKEELSAVVFLPGASRLSAEEEAKLRTVAKALRDRPALKLEVTGFVDRNRDSEGYRDELLLKKMKTEKFNALVKDKEAPAGVTLETVEIAPAEQSQWLKKVYEKEKFPRPRTFIGTLKSLPDAEMRKLILAHIVVGEEQLRELAKERSASVVDFLVRQEKLPPNRIFEKGGDIFAKPREEGINPSRVEFGVVA